MGTTSHERKKVKIDSSLIGKLVVVKFWDHSAYSKDLCVCRCAGWVVDVTENNLVIAWWDILGEPEEDTENNQEHCSIIISAIKEIQTY